MLVRPPRGAAAPLAFLLWFFHLTKRRAAYRVHEECHPSRHHPSGGPSLGRDQGPCLIRLGDRCRFVRLADRLVRYSDVLRAVPQAAHRAIRMVARRRVGRDVSPDGRRWAGGSRHGEGDRQIRGKGGDRARDRDRRAVVSAHVQDGLSVGVLPLVRRGRGHPGRVQLHADRHRRLQVVRRPKQDDGDRGSASGAHHRPDDTVASDLHRDRRKRLAYCLGGPCGGGLCVRPAGARVDGQEAGCGRDGRIAKRHWTGAPAGRAGAIRRRDRQNARLLDTDGRGSRAWARLLCLHRPRRALRHRCRVIYNGRRARPDRE